MVLLFYLMGTSGTCVCSFGKVAQNVWNGKLRTISTKWQGQIITKLNDSLISHLYFKQHWRRNNITIKCICCFEKRGEKNIFTTANSLYRICWELTNQIAIVNRAKRWFSIWNMSVMKFYVQRYFEINKICMCTHTSKYTLVTLKHCLW